MKFMEISFSNQFEGEDTSLDIIPKKIFLNAYF